MRRCSGKAKSKSKSSRLSHISVETYSGEANKLSFLYTIRGTPRDIAIKERKIKNIKIRMVPFIIYFCRNCTIMNR